MTEYLIDLILEDLAVNAESPDYTERLMNKAGTAVVCTCLVTSQVHNTEYPRYSITWKTSQEDGYIQAAYHFKPLVGSGYMRIAKIYPDDENAEQKIKSALLSGLKRGKAIYDGDVIGPWDDKYVDPNQVEVVEPIEIDHSAELVEVGSIDLLDTEEAPIMVLEEYVVSDADVDETEEWTGYNGLPDFAEWIDFEFIKIHADAPQAEEMSKIFGTTIDLARSGTFDKNIYIKIGGAACYGEAQLQYFQGYGFYVSMKSINYFVGSPQASEGDDLFLAAAGNIYAIEEPTVEEQILADTPGVYWENKKGDDFILPVDDNSDGVPDWTPEVGDVFALTGEMIQYTVLTSEVYSSGWKITTSPDISNSAGSGSLNSATVEYAIKAK